MAEGQPSKLSFAEMVRGSHLDENAASPPSSYKGEPALILSDQEVATLSSPLRFALIGKFLTDRPSMEFLRKGFKTIGFKGDFHLGLMDRKHILIRFDLEEDYHRCWLHGSWSFKDYVMRVLKWTSEFSVAEDPPVVPVWVSLEHLPLYLFARGPLFSIGRLIGQPMKIDAATLSLSRPSVARVCVEVDLRRPLPSRLWIGHPGGGFWQPIAYDSLPAYCFDCRTLGHLQKDCGKQITCAPSVCEQQVWKPKEKSITPTVALSTQLPIAGLTPQEQQTIPIDVPAASKVVAGQPEESTPTDNPLMPSIISATPAAKVSAAETPHAEENSLVSPAAEEPASTSQPINITTNKSALVVDFTHLLRPNQPTTQAMEGVLCGTNQPTSTTTDTLRGQLSTQTQTFASQLFVSPQRQILPHTDGPPCQSFQNSQSSAEDEDEDEENEFFMDKEYIRDDFYLDQRKSRRQSRENLSTQFRRNRGRPPGSRRTYFDIVRTVNTRSHTVD